ncbi:adenylate kinase, partial [Lactiplantibacillus plantarum]
MNTPLLDYYKENGLLHEVDGNQDIDKVFADIKAILDNLK